jgi:hypothetical protein
VDNRIRPVGAIAKPGHETRISTIDEIILSVWKYYLLQPPAAIVGNG